MIEITEQEGHTHRSRGLEGHTHRSRGLEGHTHRSEGLSDWRLSSLSLTSPGKWTENTFLYTVMTWERVVEGEERVLRLL